MAPPPPPPEPEPVAAEPEADWRGGYEVERFEPEPPRRYRRNPARLWTMIAVGAALLMVGALAAIYFVGPQQIAAWMGSGEESGERLRFTRQTAAREPLPTDKELLTVSGEITNVSGETQRLPQILVEVTDEQQNRIYEWRIAPPVDELQPGQAVTFTGTSTDVPKGGRNVNLTFGITA